MRQQIVAGNWKMNTTPTEGFALAKDVIAQSAQSPNNVELIICPPFTHIAEVAKAVRGTRIHLGAQNCAMWAEGAYTGEVSAKMLANIGVEYVILGHSERREHFGEQSAILLSKIQQALGNGIKPILCCGERLEERNAQQHIAVVNAQIESVISGLTAEQMQQVVLAYEPVWAIGTGLTATAQQAQEMHAHIRATVAKHFGDAQANATPILYGGSCKPSNAAELFAQPDVDGGLIGGASLKASDFIAIAQGFKE